MEEKELRTSDDMIYIEDVVNMFGGKATKNIIYAWIREKKIPAMKVGKRFVFSRNKVKSVIEKNLGSTYQ
ncbi:MAG: helix-turn-helix domain-containing protein [Acidaminococcaceae bacterium]|nr:helix-turn-helix domain-containing protein [Acidaminococcaceae bacterium]